MAKKSLAQLKRIYRYLTLHKMRGNLEELGTVGCRLMRRAAVWRAVVLVEATGAPLRSCRQIKNTNGDHRLCDFGVLASFDHLNLVLPTQQMRGKCVVGKVFRTQPLV